MRKFLPAFIVFYLLSATFLKAQTGFQFSCSRDTSVDCTQSCVNLKGLIPDVHALADNYSCNKVNKSDGSSGCFPSSAPLDVPGTSANLETDDVFTPVILLPPNFTFPFYGYYYDRLVVSTNGMITFDPTEATIPPSPPNPLSFSSWVINSNLPNTFYPRACIMGVFQDINIFETTSPSRQIKYDVIGVAPHRKWVLTFYKVPLFDCTTKINNSYQITLYEGLGLIEVFVKDRDICPGWNGGRGMIGVQNYDQDKAVMAPGRTGLGPSWFGNNLNETWRFTPKDGPSLFKKVELLNMNGSLAATGDTVAATNNNLGVVFNNVCPTATTQYIIKSTYYNFLYFFDPASWPTTDKDSLIYGMDTVTIFKNGSIPSLTVTTTAAQCGATPNGSITVTAPTGANYEYYVNNGTPQASNVFSVPPGTYTVTVHDKNGSCTKDTSVTITAPTTLAGSATSTKTSCPSASNATITVTGSLGTGSYTYAVDGGPTPAFTNSSGIFPNQTAGIHTIYIKDGAGCIKSFPDTVLSNPVFTTTANSVKASCLGASNGSLTVVPPTTGQAPYNYYIPGGVYAAPQTSPIFNNLSGDSTYIINVKDGAGCIDTFTHYVGYDPGVTATIDRQQSASCLGVDNGFIVLNPSGGTPNYQYRIDTGSAPVFVALDTIKNLAGGLYDVTIKDNIGCLFQLNDIAVAVGSGVKATSSDDSTACSAASTGRIVFTINPLFPGTGPYEYTVYGNNTYIPLDTIRNLAAGNYRYVIRDAVGCTYITLPVTIFARDPGISANVFTKATECSVALTGQVFIAPTSGVSPYVYNLDNTSFAPLNDTIRSLDTGFHSIVLKDALGCNITFNPEIVAGPGVTARDSVIISECTLASTGKIFVKPTQGIGPFQFSKDSGATWQLNIDSFINLLPATYHIAVKDAVGCSYYFNSTVGAGTGVTATDSIIKSNCSTATTGKIFIKPHAGIAPFQFSKDSGATWQLNIDSFINLLPATYHIAVKDAVGCSYYFNSTVGAGTGVTATDSTIKSNCSTATTGKIFIKPGAGVAPFQFSKDSGITWQVNIDSFINLLPGIYHIAVKDAVGCIYRLNSTVGIGLGVTATDSTAKANCATVATGKIYIKPGLGVPPFQFSNDSGNVYKFADSFLNLLPKTYHIAVMDAVGCLYRFNSTVGIGPGVIARDSVIVSECATATTGKIFIKPVSGVAPFQFSKDSGVTWQNNIDSFVNLAPRLYRLAVKDAVGCIYYFNSTVGTGRGVNATARTVNSACLGVSTGQIIVTPATGTPSYTYTMGAAAPVALDTIKSLASGIYNIVLTDAVGCSYNVPPVTVNDNIGVTATFNPVKTACTSVATGAIIVKPTTGTRVFRYSIDGGATFQYDSVFRNLGANAYTIRITDTVGCVLNSPVQNVTSNPGVVTTPSTIQNSSCASIPNGSITVNVTGGIVPFTYEQISPTGNGPQTGNQFTSLFSGSYDITVTDSAGCTKTITSVVGSNPKVKFDSLNIVRPTCNGLINGTVKINVSLGVAPYQYAIDNLAGYGNSNAFTNIGAGVHRLYVKDANNCAIDTTITVTQPAVLGIAVASKTPATCSGNPDGKIVVVANGGTSPFQYTSDVASTTGYQIIPSFDLVAGRYKITVKDTMGCTAFVNTVVDSVFTMYLELGLDTTICAEQKIVLSPNTNPETSIFTYTNASSLDNANTKNPVATPLGPTTYMLTATWGICTLTDNIKVDVKRKPVPEAGQSSPICHDTTTVLTASASNLSGTVNYSWSPVELIDTRNLDSGSAVADTITVTVRPKEQFTYFKVTVTDNYGCNFRVVDSVLVNMLPQVYAFAGNDTNAVLNAPHQLIATGAGIGGTYSWSNPPAGATISDTTIFNPIATFTPVPQPGTFHPDTNYYRLIVTATNAANCSASDTIKINVFVGPTCYVPTAFAPDGVNTANKIFRPVPVGVNIEYFRVFNRYGEAVFETGQFMQGWDGIYKGTPQPIGAYAWVLKGKDRKGREIVMKGTVMLVR